MKTAEEQKEPVLRSLARPGVEGVLIGWSYRHATTTTLKAPSSKHSSSCTQHPIYPIEHACISRAKKNLYHQLSPNCLSHHHHPDAQHQSSPALTCIYFSKPRPSWPNPPLTLVVHQAPSPLNRGRNVVLSDRFVSHLVSAFAFFLVVSRGWRDERMRDVTFESLILFLFFLAKGREDIGVL